MTDEIHELSGAYAVDALDDVEMARFERHLDDCSACRDEVESLGVAAAELSVIDTTASVPDSSADAGTPPVVTTVLLGDSDSDQTGADATGGTVTPISQGSRRSRATQGGRSAWRGLVAAGAAAVLAIGGFTIYRTVSGDNAPQSASQQVLDASDATKSVHNFPNGGSATIVRSASLGKAVLVGTDLPPPGSGKTYQLWLQGKDSAYTSAGLVPGSGNQVVVLSGDAGTAAGAGITIEPAGGSKQPTVKPLATFNFSA